MDIVHAVAIVHVLLFLVCCGYAWILEKIHDVYSPDHIWLTVAIGEGLVGLALAAVCALGALPWMALILFGTLQLFGGIPMVIWQRMQARQRRQERERGRQR